MHLGRPAADSVGGCRRDTPSVTVSSIYGIREALRLVMIASALKANPYLMTANQEGGRDRGHDIGHKDGNLGNVEVGSAFRG